MESLWCIIEVQEKYVFSAKNLALGERRMYKFDRYRQLGLADFNQPLGLKMNPENRWVKKAASIPWDEIEVKYAELFPSTTGMPAKPLRTALGSLIIQKQLKFTDRELVEEITENPYLQYFIGLPGFTTEAPFVPSLLVEFRKRLTDDILCDINEMIIDYNRPDDPTGGEGFGSDDDMETKPNAGTMILDATCAPQNIEFPQDINILNAARENLEHMVDDICYTYNFYKPRMYRDNARRDYLLLARCKKRTAKKIRVAIKKQLQYIKRDLGYIDMFIDPENGAELSDKQNARLEVIKKVYEQQLYMYQSGVHSVPDRIVSISQPYIRPIVRGKAAAPTEFGAKLDLSIDENGLGRLEKISFDAYNESEVLIQAIENYHARNGRYPERVLADKIYRNRSNLAYCKARDIRLSGPALGRPKKNASSDKRTEYIDNADRIEVERAFSLAKRCYGLGRIMTKREDTTRSSIVLSIIAMNVDHIVATSLSLNLISIFSRYSWQEILPEYSQNSNMFLECCC